MKTCVRVVACMVSFAFLLAVPSACTKADKSIAVPSASSQADKLVGVWKLTEVQYPVPGMTTTKPQPSIAIFTKKHFSMTMITGDEPRPVLPKDATEEQLRKALATFSGAAGTYEVDGSILTLNLNVSWVPNYMNKPAPQEFRFEVDNLVLTTASEDPKIHPITMKFTRLE